MNKLPYIPVLLLAATLAGCSSSPQEREDEARAAFMEERTRTVKEYKECIKKADDDEARLKTCEALLKAVEAAGGK
jgi:hypothetical protein